MFCYQCEQTAKGQGCTVAGVCGKKPETAALQDLVVLLTKGVSVFSAPAAKLGFTSPEVDKFVIDGLFTTVTNVNFDDDRIAEVIKQGVAALAKAQELYSQAGLEVNPGSIQECFAKLEVPTSLSEMEKLGEENSITVRREKVGDTLAGLEELVIYGLKGAAAYADHAGVLGETDPSFHADTQRILATIATGKCKPDDLLTAALETGQVNMLAMEMLDRAHKAKFGTPEPTAVPVTSVKGKCILISGHDLQDLLLLLQQTEGKGINVYTHGEMLPAHGYPELKKYPHLVGNYGGAWQDQVTEFDAFPGPILMTTNCIQRPKESYLSRIYTTSLVAWPGAPHIGEDKDFTPLIESALAMPGFVEDHPEKTIMVGFGADAVLGVANVVIDAVKAGAIRHFFLIGGCDGAKPGRNYFTDLATQVPDDAVILTLACGKYRFNKEEFGDIGGIPRLLDVGQCNDAYSAVRIAVALAEAFECGVNDLPLSLVLSWYEQKAVAILLTLLNLGIKDIRLGPSLPAFITPDVLNILVEKFAIKPVSTPEEDLAAILG